jgi:hemerythrin-like domain-containing protein
MDTATAVLRKEHEAILKMLAVTEEVARRLEAGEQVTLETLANLLDFFRLFADKCHHGKEEDLLFPQLEKKGMPRTGGPIWVMLAEHEQGRKLVQQMAQATEAYANEPKAAAPAWAQAARGYVALLRAHIDKENNVLFVMAERMLTPDEQTALAESFEKIEVEKMGAGTHERLHSMMAKLIKEILPAP